MVLKPQDVYVLLKVVAAGVRLAYGHLATELIMSPSEVHASIKRARASGLVHSQKFQDRPKMAALEEFLLHGLKYAFPPERGELTRGVPTSWGGPRFRALLGRTDEPVPVWPYEEGDHRGVALAPLYRTAPRAALRDAAFYELLVIADVLRDGRARERKMAEKELRRKLQDADAEFAA